ncbi:MAG: hypothetical protein WCX71_05255 [Candidatus Buchananbacteria bacterium]
MRKSNRCGRFLWYFGIPILEIYDVANGEFQEEVELFARCVAGVSGQRVDWYAAGGHAVVLFFGNEVKVMGAIERLKGRFRFKSIPL